MISLAPAQAVDAQLKFLVDWTAPAPIARSNGPSS